MFGAHLVILNQSYHADKIKFTDGRMDRRTDADSDNTPFAWKVKGYKCKYDFMFPHNIAAPEWQTAL